MANHNLLEDSLDNLDQRLWQRRAAAPAVLSIAPLDQLATLATNFLPFLFAHGVTSQV
jgi:hypothetical protein